MNIFHTLIFIILFSFFTYDMALSQQDSQENSGVIITIGDSLTAGFGVDISQSYPALLEDKLQRDGYNYTVINSGVSGETSSGTLSRLEWILEMGADIVIIETGANDGLRGIPTAILHENLKNIMEILQKKNIITILAGMQMVWNLGEEYTTEFSTTYSEIAQEYEILFMPFFLKDVATIQHLNQMDGIHPTGEGYAIITENIYPYVLKAIKQHQESK